MLNIDELKYRGEGNNNIVLADSQGKIYRVRKCSVPCQLSTKKTRAHKKSRQLTVLFGQHRMARYFGTNFLLSGELLDVDNSVLRTINDRFKSSRPVFRLDREVDVNAKRILATPDATCLPLNLSVYGEGPVICVEIKPKFGAILRGPDRDPIESATHRNALFCMMQYHENKVRMWGRRTSYCPCDLFSGNPKRVLRALLAMLEVRQNNLRVFRDSMLVLNNTRNELDDALRAFFQFSSDENECRNHDCENSCDSVHVTPPLPHSSDEELSSSDGFSVATASSTECVSSPKCPFHSSTSVPLRSRFLEGLIMPALLREVPFAPATSVESIAACCGSVKRPSTFRYDCDLHQFDVAASQEVPLTSPVLASCPQDLPLNSPLGRIFSTQLESALSHADLIEHYDAVKAYFEEHEISWNSYIAGKVIVNDEEAPPNIIKSLSLVEKHLVAMVARDCSIMLTFQRAKDSCPVDVLTVGGDCPCVPRTIVRISIVDLDPKDLSNLQERVNAERRVVEAFLNHRKD